MKMEATIMADGLQTRHVFLDACVFVKSNFDFESKSFVAFATMASQGRVHVPLTTITAKEVVKNVSEALQEAERAMKKCRSDARILRNIDRADVASLFQGWNFDSPWSQAGAAGSAPGP